MAVINISTVANPTGTKLVPGGGGGIENIPFLQLNANAAVVFATFWIETIRPSLSGFHADPVCANCHPELSDHQTGRSPGALQLAPRLRCNAQKDLRGQ
jgi:hypothetical protein